jgi:serine protease Do
MMFDLIAAKEIQFLPPAYMQVKAYLGRVRLVLATLVLLCLMLCLAPHTAKAAQTVTQPQGLTPAKTQTATIDDMVGSQIAPINSTLALNASEQSVVRVLVVYRGYGGQPLDQVGMGSGFVIAPGKIITNYHVIETPPDASSAEIYIVPHKSTGQSYQPVTLIKAWTEGDLALLSAPDLKVEPLSLYLTPVKNLHVIAMGYPGVTDRLLKRGGEELLEPTDPYVTQGFIALFAATNPDGARIDSLFHTAPINPGNSGGPLLNECGQVVGINTWSAASTLSDTGDIDMPAGQYVATHVSALNNFLKANEITAKIISVPCYAKSSDDIIKDDALSKALAAAAESQKTRLDEQLKTEANQSLMGQLQLGALILLSILVLVLIALLIRRGPTHASRQEKPAPTAFSYPKPDEDSKIKPEGFTSDMTETQKSNLLAEPKLSVAAINLKKQAKSVVGHRASVPWGWLLLGLGVAIIAAAFVFSHGQIEDKLRRLQSTYPFILQDKPKSVGASGLGVHN